MPPGNYVLPKPVNILVLVSGNGSNLQALLDSGIEVALVVADRECNGLSRAAAAGVAFERIPRKKQERLLPLLTERGIGFVVTAGYLSILPPEVVRAYPRKIVNIHPSLLPAFGGMGFYGLKVHEAVLASGAKTTGATVHYVEEGVDTGEVIISREVPVLRSDTADILQARVLETEHALLVETVKKLISEV